MQPFAWNRRSDFINRAGDLAALERWWESPTGDALALIGRRRVGKSWLFRRFGDGKAAIILVADQRLLSTQMQRFARQLEPLIGFRPDLPDLRSLLEVLYRLGRDQKLLVVIDEFPYLLPDGPARRVALSEAQAVMEEERDQSQIRLVLCGSLISQMESLLEAASPLHGRLQELDVWPMSFSEGAPLREGGETAADAITRYAIAGGMARYLAELGRGTPLKTLVCERALDRRGPLFNDPRGVLEQELRSPATYFSILEELSQHPAQTEHLTNRLQLNAAAVWPFIRTLQRMRLLNSSLPIGAPTNARAHKHEISDGFVRFWFRFIFPNQDTLQSGLRPEDLWEAEIESQLPDFVSPTFEALCAQYVRRSRGSTAPQVGGWWGKALNRHRQAKDRFTEEVDIVGAQHKRLKIVGECKWTNEAVPLSVLSDLREFKIPAIDQEGRLKVPKAGPEILLFSRSGFSAELVTEAAEDKRVTLIELDDLVGGLG